MIKSIHGVTKEPFNRNSLALPPQQKQILDIIKIHSHQGGFSAVVGEPGVSKSVLKEHIENLGKERESTVVSCARTLHTYLAFLKQLAESFRIEVPAKALEQEEINLTLPRYAEIKSSLDTTA
jgi:ABC-type Mn2+/Zn2+ transport system ATPase subunit